MKLGENDQDKERPLVFQFDLLVDEDDLLVLSLVVDFSSNVVIIVWLSYLISKLAVNGHGFELV